MSNIKIKLSKKLALLGLATMLITTFSITAFANQNSDFITLPGEVEHNQAYYDEVSKNTDKQIELYFEHYGDDNPGIYAEYPSDGDQKVIEIDAEKYAEAGIPFSYELTDEMSCHDIYDPVKGGYCKYDAETGDYTFEPDPISDLG